MRSQRGFLMAREGCHNARGFPGEDSMLRPIALAAALVLGAASPALTPTAPGSFDAAFERRTMRVDYFHTNDHGREIVALDRTVSDGPWAGSRTRLLDELNL